MRYTKTEIEGARERLAGLLRTGDTIYTVLRRVSRSGLSREIDLYVIRDNKPVLLTYSAAALLGLPVGHRGVKVQGGGMDMGFHLVYDLGRCLYPDGFSCTGQGCPSADHKNEWKPNYGFRVHQSGGYAFRHELL